MRRNKKLMACLMGITLFITMFSGTGQQKAKADGNDPYPIPFVTLLPANINIIDLYHPSATTAPTTGPAVTATPSPEPAGKADVALKKSSVSVVMGEMLYLSDIVKKGTGVGISFKSSKDAAKCKKYFNIVQVQKTVCENGQYFALSGEKEPAIQTSSNGKYFKNMKDSIKLKIKIRDAENEALTAEKTLTVKLKIPEPEVEIKTSYLPKSREYKYLFKYNIQGGDKVKVECVNNKGKWIEFTQKYITKPKSGKDSYVTWSKSVLKKYHYKMKFRFTAYYGKKKTKTITLTKKAR